MVKKISNRGRSSGNEGERKSLQAKRLKLKQLHKKVAHDRAALDGTLPENLPPASSSNAARQARSQLDITFPVDWQELHLKKSAQANEDEQDSEERSND